MSSVDPNWDPLKGLTEDEIEVECTVRDIDMTKLDWEVVLSREITNEINKASSRPTQCHVIDYKNELDLCRNQAALISNTLEDQRILTAENLPDIKTRIRHWKDRTYRLKRCFHQDNEVDKLVNQWRRLDNSCKICLEKQNDLIISTPTIHTPTATIVDSLTDLNINNQASESIGTSMLNVNFDTENLMIYTSNNQLFQTAPDSTKVTWSKNIVTSNCVIPPQPTNLPKFSNYRSSMNQEYDIIPNKPMNYKTGRNNYQNRFGSIPQKQQQNQNQVDDVPTPASYSNNYQMAAPPITNPFSIPSSIKFEPKWNISFSGTPQGLDVHDFVFRLESFAFREQVPVNQLYAILPRFLKDVAEKWYWVFTQKYPTASYNQLRQSLIQRFSSIESDCATRRFIETRKQRSTESLSDFILEVESLNHRLNRPFPELDLLEIIRENMGYDLQQMTLHLDVSSIEHLRIIGHRYERLWDRKRVDRSLPIDRRPRYINELSQGESVAHETTPVSHYGILNPLYKPIVPNENSRYIDSISNRQVLPNANVVPSHGVSAKQHLVCWNCRLPDHRYQDCTLPPQGIFCYGCGVKDTIKPHCTHCQRRAENQTPGVTRAGMTRPAYLLTRPQNETPHYH